MYHSDIEKIVVRVDVLEACHYYSLKSSFGKTYLQGSKAECEEELENALKLLSRNYPDFVESLVFDWAIAVYSGKKLKSFDMSKCAKEIDNLLLNKSGYLFPKELSQNLNTLKPRLRASLIITCGLLQHLRLGFMGKKWTVEVNKRL